MYRLIDINTGLQINPETNELDLEWLNDSPMDGTGLSYADLNQDMQMMPAPPAPPPAVNTFIYVDLNDVNNILMPPPPLPPAMIPMNNLFVQAEVHGPPPLPAPVASPAPPALAAPPAHIVVPKYLSEDAVDDDQMPTLSPQNTV